MRQNSREIRAAIEADWWRRFSVRGGLFSSDSLSGATPPSVFVGSYGYPRVAVGPMVPPVHGDTTVLDAPERWVGRSLGEIVDYRLSLVRGTKKIPVGDASGRYVEGLQEVAMASGPIESEIEFAKAVSPGDPPRRGKRPVRACGQHQARKIRGCHTGAPHRTGVL